MSTYLHYICRTRIKNGAADSPNAADSTLSIVFHFRARARVRSYRVKLFPLLNILFCFVNQTNKKTHSKTPCVLFSLDQTPRQCIHLPSYTQPPPYRLLRPMMLVGKPLDATRDLF